MQSYGFQIAVRTVGDDTGNLPLLVLRGCAESDCCAEGKAQQEDLIPINGRMLPHAFDNSKHVENAFTTILYSSSRAFPQHNVIAFDIESFCNRKRLTPTCAASMDEHNRWILLPVIGQVPDRFLRLNVSAGRPNSPRIQARRSSPQRPSPVQSTQACGPRKPSLQYNDR